MKTTDRIQHARKRLLADFVAENALPKLCANPTAKKRRPQQTGL